MNNYYGIDRSRGLNHWKYTSRKRVGDHWVYVYPDGSSSGTDKKGNTTTTMSPWKGDVHKTTTTTDTSHLWTYRTDKTYKTDKETAAKVYDKDADMKTEHHASGKVTETRIEYGKMHVMEMNAKRKVKDFVKNSASNGKQWMKKHPADVNSPRGHYEQEKKKQKPKKPKKTYVYRESTRF